MQPAEIFSTTSAMALTADGSWVHLFPKAGQVVARDGRRWKLSDPDAVIAKTRAYHGQKPIAVDYDHQLARSEKNGQPAVAAGWITDLQARADGIWGLVEWTEKAAAHLAAREYRFISPMFAHSKATSEITLLINAGLTNEPALEMTALASARKDTMNTIEQELRSLLNLAGDAPADAILESVRTLATEAKDGASARPDQFVPIALFEQVTAELNRTNQGMSLAAATVVVEQQIASGKLIPSMRDWALDLCRTNRPAFDRFIERTGGAFQHLMTRHTPIGSLEDRRAGLTDIETEIAQALGHTPQEMKAGK